jgi:hypothetical protein
MTRILTCLAATALFSSNALAQGGRAVGGDMPVAPAAPPQGAIAVMPQPQQSVTSSTVRSDRVRDPRRPEDYGGVAPGSRQVPPGMRRLAARRNPGPVVAWPGFQMLPTQGSRVFIVGTAGTTMVEGPRTPTQRSYLFPGARLFLYNNSRPLETALFATPLVRARLRAVRGGVSLVLDVRAEVNPVQGQEAAGNGLVFHYLDFPAFAVSEVARIRLSNGLEISATPQGAPIAPAPGGTAVDNERPPPVMR